MKRTLSVFFALLLFIAAPVQSFNWSNIATRLQESSFAISTLEGKIYCTGFVVDNKRDYALTADHCMHNRWVEEGGTMVDGVVPEELWGDDALDVAVLHIPGIDRPELKPQFKPARAGQEMGSFGFARESGLKEHFRAGVVSGVEAVVDGLDGAWTVTDQPFIGGMSGGPVVDTDGKLISMVQRSNSVTGIGRSIQEIWLATRSYWKN